MIRKVIIVVLMLGAVGTSAVWCFVRDAHLRDPGTGNTPELRLRKFDGRLLLCYGVWLEDRPSVTIEVQSDVSWRWLGFSHDTYRSLPDPPPYMDGWTIGVPLWFVILFLLTYPFIAFIRGPVRRYRRRQRGLCVRCGYNLTGNVSGICPECGTMMRVT